MSGRRGTEQRALSESVLVRLSPEAASAVAARAAERGLSRAAWLRDLAVAAAQLPFAERRPSRPAAAPVRPRADLAALARLAGALGRAAGATIQVARALRERGAAERHAEAEAVLRALKASQQELVALIERLRDQESAA
jgi:hypothetical protein